MCCIKQHSIHFKNIFLLVTQYLSLRARNITFLQYLTRKKASQLVEEIVTWLNPLPIQDQEGIYNVYFFKSFISNVQSFFSAIAIMYPLAPLSVEKEKDIHFLEELQSQQKNLRIRDQAHTKQNHQLEILQNSPWDQRPLKAASKRALFKLQAREHILF